MKKTKLTRSLLAACSIVALSAVMYGCTHNGDDDTTPAVEMPDPPEPMPTTGTLTPPDGHELGTGTTTFMGGPTQVGDRTTVTCEADEGNDAGCSVTVSQDSVTGAVTVSYSGGTVMVTVAEPPAPPMPMDVALNGSTDLSEGMTTIPAGVIRTVGDTTITCTGTEDCVLTVTEDPVTGEMSATSTGGAVTVAYNPPPPGPTEGEIAETEKQKDQGHYRARQLGGTVSRLMDDGMRAVHDTLPAYLTFTDDGTTGDVDENVLVDRATVMGIDHDGDMDTASSHMDAGNNPPSLGGKWNGNILEQDLAGGATDHIIIYSDADPNMSESFGTAYGEIGNTGGNGADRPADLAASTTEEQRTTYAEAYATYSKTVRDVDFTEETKPGTGHYNGAPTVTAADSPATFWGFVESAGFPARPMAGTVQSRDYFGPGEDPANTTQGLSAGDEGYNANGEMFPGTFDGVAGMFECIASQGCTVTHSATVGLASSPGTGQATDGQWQFTATDPMATVGTTRPDADYLTMGIWIEIPDAVEGTHKLSPFYGGRDPFVEANVANALEGTAKYEGPAVGKYVTRGRGTNDAENGVFTATANLEAAFGEGDELGSISGKVTGFQGEGDHNLGDWQVTLGSVGLSNGANTFAGGSVMSDTSRANGRHWTTGEWEGQFFGNGDAATDHPGSVAGQFDARWGSAWMITPATNDIGYVGVAGVFGANLVPPPPAEDDQ